MIGSLKKRDVVKEEKSKKKRKRLEYRAPTFFTNKKLKEKFDRRWVGKEGCL